MIEICVPLASNDTRSGVITGESNVETVVIPTENATSPPHRYDIIFDETPPGQQPTRISPSAIPSGRFNAFVSANARNGMIKILGDRTDADIKWSLCQNLKILCCKCKSHTKHDDSDND